MSTPTVRSAPTNDPTALASLPDPERLVFPPLPVPLTSLIGRDREATAVVALFRQPGVRLVTLTGPGGVGKTRLALRIAGDPTADLGLPAFVPLAPISDPTLVLPTVARYAGLVDGSDAPPLDRLAAAIGNERCLLILDNVEQVMGAAPLLPDLLAACPGLALLVTSRAVLRVSGEHDYPVPPLPLPGPEGSTVPTDLADVDAIRLFLERARTVDPTLASTPANLAAIASVCRRLDGLPLAIELAAARANLLPPAAMLTHLGQRLSMLTGGPRDVPDRLRTMREAIAWSDDLLAPGEQSLFRRLAVFSGGFTVGAAEAVAADDQLASDPANVLDGLASLTDQSLVRRAEGEAGEAIDPRFAMLETVREYASERLRASGEERPVREAHAAHYLALAERAKEGLKGSTEAYWLDRLEADHDNLRAAFDWLLAATPAAALRLGMLLARFWAFRGYGAEGFARLEAALAADVSGPTQDRACAANEAGAQAEILGLFDRAEALYHEALRIWRGLGDDEGASKALDYLGYLAQLRGDVSRAIAWHQEALAAAVASGNPRVIRTVRVNLAGALAARGDLTEASRLLEASLAEARAADDPYQTSVALNDLGAIALQQGDHARAVAHHEESLGLKRGLGHLSGIAEALDGLGRALVAGGEVERGAASIAEAVDRHRALADPHQAAVAQLHLAGALLGRDDARSGALLAEVVSTFHHLGDRASLADALEAIAERAVRRDAPAAVRLCGAAASLRSTTGATRHPAAVSGYERAMTTARRNLGDDAFAAAMDTGRGVPIEVIVAEAIAVAVVSLPTASPPDAADAAEAALPAGGKLSPREREVLRLLTAGLPDREIARVLSIGTRTVEWHVANVLTKLDVGTRAAAAAFAVRQGLG